MTLAPTWMFLQCRMHDHWRRHIFTELLNFNHADDSSDYPLAGILITVSRNDMRSIKISISLLFTFILQKDLLGQSYPKFTAMIGGLEGGQIKRGAFLAQQGVGGMRWIAVNHWEYMPIDSFTIMFKRDTTIILHLKNQGPYFSDNLKSQLQNMQVNDRIIVYDIYGRNYGNVTVFIRPIEFIIE